MSNRLNPDQWSGSIRHWITGRDLTPDPDPAFFVSGFQETKKNNFFPKFFLLNTVLTVGTFT